MNKKQAMSLLKLIADLYQVMEQPDDPQPATKTQTKDSDT